MTKVSAIVLAAGLSTRMEGANKLFLPFGERTILGEVLYQLSTSDADELVVVSSELTHEEIKTVLNDQPIDCRLVMNNNYRDGMTTSIQQGVSAADLQADGYMICLGDMPNITTSIYNEVLGGFRSSTSNKTIVLPFFKKKRGNPAIFSNYYQRDILEHKEMEGCKSIIQKNFEHVIKVDVTSAGVLQDIDTQEMYKQIKPT